MRNRSRVGIVYPARGHRSTQRSRSEYGHPSHRGFARAIEATDIVVPYRGLRGPLRGTVVADVVSAARAHLPERDLYLLENDAVLYAAPIIHRRCPEATIVHLSASDRLLGRVFVGRTAEPTLRRLKRRGNAHLDHALLRRLLTRYCDGVIAVSEFARDRLRSVAGSSLPVRVATPYIQPELYASLPTVGPDLSSKVAVTLGEPRAHKGVDLLVDAWTTVRDRHPDAELRIVGRGYPGEYADQPGVTLRGFVESVEAEFAATSLYVHPAYIEPFGVSVLEAMRAGLPAVVTDTTGAASVVERVDDSMVVPASTRALADAVCDYFESDLASRRARSDAARTATDSYSEPVRTSRFRRQFTALVDEIQ